jgi:hypothetical protein
VGLRGGFHDEVGGADEVVEGEVGRGRGERGEEALAALAVPRRGAGQLEPRQAAVERAADRPADDSEPDDTDVHRCPPLPPRSARRAA